MAASSAKSEVFIAGAEAKSEKEYSVLAFGDKY